MQDKYADDAVAMGCLFAVRAWWDDVGIIGPGYGYHTNPAKTWLVTKPEHKDKALKMFEGTGISITTEGRPYLGSPVGTDSSQSPLLKIGLEVGLCV